MKFKLEKDSEIYIICPANVDTGGPMCLHELAYILKNKFKKKYIYIIILDQLKIQFIKIINILRFLLKIKLMI